jgi:hypothetical protein
MKLLKILVPTFASPPEHSPGITDVEGQIVAFRESLRAAEYYRCADVKALMAEIRAAVTAHEEAWCDFAEQPSVPLMGKVIGTGAVLEALTKDATS